MKIQIKRNSQVKRKSKNKVHDEEKGSPSVTQLGSFTDPVEENVHTPCKIVQTKSKISEGKMSKEGKLQVHSNRGSRVRTFPCDYCPKVSCFSTSKNKNRNCCVDR